MVGRPIDRYTNTSNKQNDGEEQLKLEELVERTINSKTDTWTEAQTP